MGLVFLYWRECVSTLANPDWFVFIFSFIIDMAARDSPSPCHPTKTATTETEVADRCDRRLYVGNLASEVTE
jgi:uncharacterized protein YfaQ (DUF2300 family)